MRDARILVVDDDEDFGRALCAALADDDEQCSYDCKSVTSVSLALEALELESFDLVVSDIQMGGLNGMALLDRMRARGSNVPVIFVTGFASLKQAVDATKRGASDYLTKPFEVTALHAAVARALDERRVSPASTRPPSLRTPPNLGTLIGDSAPMRVLREKIDLVAQVAAPVLLLGESGTGKELVARAIHDQGARSGKPFVAVNVSAIPEQLLESEIFGHVRGAFTGAHAARRGLLSEADGGTILLDEIGDMPIALQAKLLRVLQSGEVRPVGSDKTHSVDVRVIAATHRDLVASMQRETFREDLYFRLNVVPIVVPPLRDHADDVPALAHHFLARARDRFPRAAVRAISPEALLHLAHSPWRGNVRELESAIERLVILVREETILPAHLAFVTSERSPNIPSWAPNDGAPCSLKAMSSAYVAWVVAREDGNKVRAAALLGVNLSTLYRWQRARQSMGEGAEQ